MQILRESKPLMKCSLTFPCSLPCRNETFWRRRDATAVQRILKQTIDRSSTGCHKHIRSALWSTIVILIRSRIVLVVPATARNTHPCVCSLSRTSLCARCETLRNLVRITISLTRQTLCACDILRTTWLGLRQLQFHSPSKRFVPARQVS